MECSVTKKLHNLRDSVSQNRGFASKAGVTNGLTNVLYGGILCSCKKCYLISLNKKNYYLVAHNPTE
jgi:hypothetical protein